MSEPSAPPGSEEKPRGATELGGPVERQHASDQVFRDIAVAIMNRELAAGSALPPERELSERFGVSRIVVREAIHRLKEYELVRVRQGSPTMVLDPDRATDIRLLGLEIDLVALSPEGMTAFAERQTYSAAALLDLAEQRMTEDEIEGLEKTVDDFLARGDADRTWLAFEREFWVALAKGTRNRIYIRETLWHFNLLERDVKFRDVLAGDPMARGRLYKALIETLRRRTGSATLYLNALRLARPSSPP